MNLIPLSLGYDKEPFSDGSGWPRQVRHVNPDAIALVSPHCYGGVRSRILIGGETYYSDLEPDELLAQIEALRVQAWMGGLAVQDGQPPPPIQKPRISLAELVARRKT